MMSRSAKRLEAMFITRLQTAIEFAIQQDWQHWYFKWRKTFIYERYVWKDDFMGDLLHYLNLP
jgi:hypothetical protein